MRALVTGATGFIGSNLAKELDKKGWEVIALGKDNEQPLNNFSGKLIKKPFHEIDWNEIGNIDILFHQAAIVNTVFNDEKEMFFVNVETAIKLFKRAIIHDCNKIIYASSTAVYGNTPSPFVEGKSEEPLNIYGKSKLLLDRMAMKLAEKNPDIKIVGLRYCNVFGPGENHKGKMANMVYQLAQQILYDKPEVFKYGEQKRDEIYVKDVVKANLCALNAKESCVVNCGTGKPVSFNEIIAILNEILGKNKETIYIDNPYPFFQTHTECDMKKAKETIGFVPEYSFEEGVKDYYKTGWLTKPPIK
ncbi:MAG: NAD-dependent epimerase/dehydratase family protein [Nanoarchaeota archaeon]|nr:NAD-dependent epimerase/dehydratase family protein [Nanoarchaeota archaeon]